MTRGELPRIAVRSRASILALSQRRGGPPSVHREVYRNRPVRTAQSAGEAGVVDGGRGA